MTPDASLPPADVQRPTPPLTDEELAEWDTAFAGWQPRTISAWVEMAGRGRRLIAEVERLREELAERVVATGA